MLSLKIPDAFCWQHHHSAQQNLPWTVHPSAPKKQILRSPTEFLQPAQSARKTHGLMNWYRKTLLVEIILHQFLVVSRWLSYYLSGFIVIYTSQVVGRCWFRGRRWDDCRIPEAKQISSWLFPGIKEHQNENTVCPFLQFLFCNQLTSTYFKTFQNSHDA